jgi:hypothetical protein
MRKGFVVEAERDKSVRDLVLVNVAQDCAENFCDVRCAVEAHADARGRAHLSLDALHLDLGDFGDTVADIATRQLAPILLEHRAKAKGPL